MRDAPDFVGIGAHAAGSTWIWQWLQKHPEIGFLRPETGPPRAQTGEGVWNRRSDADWRRKEAHFWDLEPDTPVERYLERFDWSKPIVGEITPAYARLGSEVLARVKRTFPDLKVFFVVRDPLERTWSDVKKRLRKLGLLSAPNLVDHAIAEASRAKVSARNAYLATLRCWTEHFGSGQFRCFCFEDIEQDPKWILSNLAEWLGADPEFYATARPEELALPVNRISGPPCPADFIEWFDRQYPRPWPQVRADLEASGFVVRPTD